MIGETCSTYGVRGEVLTASWLGNVKERESLEGLTVDGMIMLK